MLLPVKVLLFILDIFDLLFQKRYSKLETLHRMYPNMYNDVRKNDLMNRTFIFDACYFDYTSHIVEYLLRQNIDIKIQDTFGNTSMHVSASNGCTNISKLLYEYDPSCINIRNVMNQSPFHVAVIENSIETIEWMLNETNIDITSQYMFDDTVLHMAARYGYTDILKLLYENNASSINIVNKFNETPLHTAVYLDNFEVVKWTLEETIIDLDIKDRNDKTVDQIDKTVDGKNIDTRIKQVIETRRTNK